MVPGSLVPCLVPGLVAAIQRSSLLTLGIGSGSQILGLLRISLTVPQARKVRQHSFYGTTGLLTMFKYDAFFL